MCEMAKRNCHIRAAGGHHHRPATNKVNTDAPTRQLVVLIFGGVLVDAGPFHLSLQATSCIKRDTWTCAEQIMTSSVARLNINQVSGMG